MGSRVWNFAVIIAYDGLLYMYPRKKIVFESRVSPIGGTEACCMKYYKLISSQESYKFGEC